MVVRWRKVHVFFLFYAVARIDSNLGTIHISQIFTKLSTFNRVNKKHLKNVGPIRHCEPPHAACFTLPFTRCRYYRTPPAHRCPQQHRQQRQQRQRVTEGTAMAPWNGPNDQSDQFWCAACSRHAYVS